MSRRQKNKKSQGFTLVELMVVAAIIALLSSVILANMSSARSRARDAERRTMLSTLRLALDFYYDKYGVYPDTSGEYYSSEPGNFISDNGGDWIPGLAPEFAPALPRDPLGGLSSDKSSSPCSGVLRGYIYVSSATHYVLMSFCGAELPIKAEDPLYYETYSGYALRVSNPGAPNW